MGKKSKYIPYRKEANKMFMAILCLSILCFFAFEYKDHFNNDNIVFLFIFLFFILLTIAWRSGKSVFFRIRGILTEKRSYWYLRLFFPFAKISRNLPNSSGYGDVDVLLEIPGHRWVIEIKSARSTWNFENSSSLDWNPKGIKALIQTSRIAQKMKAKAVLWLPLCNRNFYVYRNGVLIVGGGVWMLKIALKDDE